MTTLAPSPLIDPDAESARSCVRCGYSLVGFSEEDGRRPCPECGLLSGLSFLDARDLKNNRPRWLGSLAWGAGLTAAGLATAVPGVLSYDLMGKWRRMQYFRGPNRAFFNTDVPEGFASWAGFIRGEQWELWGMVGLVAVPPLLLLVGMLMLTRPAGRARADRADAARRWAIRLLAVAPALAFALPAAITFNLLPRPVLVRGEWTLFGVTALLAPLPVLLFTHLKDLARRAPAPLLAADSPVVGWVFGLGLLLPLALYLVGLLFDATGVSQGRGIISDFFLVVIGVLAAIAFAACLWSFYLLIRYALAFRKSARQAATVWAAADLSGTTDRP